MLIGLGAFALYAATAAAALWLARRFVTPLGRGPALLLAAAPLLLTGKAFVTGGVVAPLDILYDADPFVARRVALEVPQDRVPILGDVVYMNIPGRAAVRASLARGDLPLWNPYVLAGDPLLAMQQPAVLHPFAGLALLLPLPQAWNFEMALRLFLALLSGYLFFEDLLAAEAAAILGAVAWAFSDYAVFYLGFPHTLAVAPFPLLLLGLRRLARHPDRGAVGVTVTALVLMLTAGHPETLLFACAGAGPFFSFEMSQAPSALRTRALGLALLSGALALGLAAVLLLPLAETMPQSAEHVFRKAWYAHQKRSESAELVLRRLPAQLAPYVVGVPGHGDRLPGFDVPACYAGALLFPFAAAGLLGKRRSRWFFLGLGLASLSVCAKTPAADWLAKLPLFDIAINEYSIFLAAFALCALAALGAARLREGDGTLAFLGASAASVVVLVGLSLRLAPQMASLGMPDGFARGRLLLQVVPIAVAAVVLAAFVRRGRAASAVPVLVFLFVAERAAETFAVSPTLPETAFYPEFAVLDRIPRGAPFRFAATGMTLLPNASVVYGLEDARGYEAMRLEALVQTFPLWCVAQSFWFNRVDDPTLPFLSFLNVRWVLTPQSTAPPNGWPVLAEGDRVRLLENPRVLPRAFIPRLYRGEPDPGKRLALLGEIRDFHERGVVATDTGGEWVENGRAKVTIESYQPQRIALTVEAEAETLIGTSITNWPGWKVDVDGHPVPTAPFNHAFLAFRAPPGSHRATVRYAPDGVRDGAAISLATAVLAVLLLFRRRRAVA